MDETGLFFCLSAEKGLATRQMSGRKAEKLGCTIVHVCNSDGSEMLKPWVIWRYQNPRDMKHVNRDNLGVVYRSNPKAWMTGVLFNEWIQWFDDLMHSQGRQVLLLMDNCKPHQAQLDTPLRCHDPGHDTSLTTSQTRPDLAGPRDRPLPFHMSTIAHPNTLTLTPTL